MKAALRETITMIFNAGQLQQKLFGRQNMSLMMEMNGIAEQNLHGSGPGLGGVSLHHRFQVAQLMSQAKLIEPGRSI